MADLEEHAIKRDRRFLVRLVLMLLVGFVGGAFVYAQITKLDVGACLARTFMGVSDEPDASP